jgi:hypothetical protein
MVAADEVFWQMMSAFHAFTRNINAHHPIMLTVVVVTEVFARSFNPFEGSTILWVNTKFVIHPHDFIQVIDTFGRIIDWLESAITSIPVDMVPSGWSVCVVQQPILVPPSTIALLLCLYTDIANSLRQKHLGCC